MDCAERIGFGGAVAGHALLFAALSLTIAHRIPPARPMPDAMDVQLVDDVGLRSAAPEPASEAPQEAQAPDVGPAMEAPPPPATPAPPTPAPPKAIAPSSVPAPTPAKPAPAKPALSSDLLKDIRSAAKTERATGPRLGPDFLKGVIGASAGAGISARAAVTGPALNGLAAAIKRQVQPCYDLGGLGGTPAMQIITVLQLRFNPDGSVAGTPQLVEQEGLNDANRRYAGQMIDVSRRAILKCAPLKLPPELYAGGWENITMGFRPG